MMNTSFPKLWFSFVSGNHYPEQDAYFFDVAATEWAVTLNQNWELIHQELAAVLAQQDEGIIPYFNRNLANKPQQWRIFPFLMWGLKLHKNCEKCPKTMELLQSIPHLSSASFSILDAHTSIQPHLGDTNAIYRCHLGLSIPAGLPQCGIQVGKEEGAWENGKVIAFCDAQKHRAWNHTNQKRYILIFDVIRPEFAEQQYAISDKILGALFWQTLFQRFYIIGHLPAFMRNWLMVWSSYPARIFRWWHNRKR